MKVKSVDEDLYGALKAAADSKWQDGPRVGGRGGCRLARGIAVDEADHAAIEQSRAEAAERDGIEFEEFFDELLRDRD